MAQTFTQKVRSTAVKTMAWLTLSGAIAGCTLSTKFDSRIEAYQKQKSEFERTVPKTDSLKALCERGEYAAFSKMFQSAASMTEQIKTTNAELAQDIKKAQKEIPSGPFYSWYISGVPVQVRNNEFQYNSKLRDEYYLWTRYQDVLVDLSKDVLNWYGLSYGRLLVQDDCSKKSDWPSKK